MLAKSLNRNGWLVSLESWWQQRFFRWLDRKIPKADSYQLNLRNLYILPTRLGFVFILLIAVLWVLGSNYQNNLILALCYLLTSLVIVTMHHTHANLSGLRVRAANAKPVFAGDQAFFPVYIRSQRKDGNDALRIRWQHGEWFSADIGEGDSEQIAIAALTSERGVLRPGRLLIETEFPLGLMRCWSWLNFDVEALVYPKPMTIAEPLSASGDADEAEAVTQTIHGDDFYGLRSYQAGDSLKHVAWKHYAKEKGLHSKDYQQGLTGEKVLSWDSLRYLPVEERISALCYLCLHYSQQDIPFAVMLPGHTLPAASGSAHREKVLRLLALLPKTVV